MKKKMFCMAITLILLVSLISGCSDNNTILADSVSTIENMYQESKDIVIEELPGELELVSPNGGVLYSAYAGTADGCYEFISHPDGTANILYTDYATRQKIYLSSQTNTDHRSEADPSWIDNVMGGGAIIVAGEHLFFFTFGKTSLVEEFGDKGKSSITRMDLTGRNRNKILMDASKEIVPSSCIAFDSKNLYFLAYEYSMEEDQTSCNLISLNTKKMQLEVIDKFDDGRYYLAGIYPDGLVLNKVSISDKATYTDMEEAYANSKSEIILYSLKDSTITSVLSSDYNEISFIVHDNKLFYFKAFENSLYSLDFISNEVSEINSQVIQDDIAFESLVVIGDIYDDHVFINCSDSELGEARMFAVSLKDGSAVEINRTQDGRFPGIFAENEEYFYVHTGEIPYTFNDTFDGVPIVNETAAMKLSLISKDGFWQNSNDYIEIDDHVFTNN